MQETFKTKVISGGRITIPETIRVLLRIEEGDIVEILINKIKSLSLDGTPGPHTAQDPLLVSVGASVNPKESS